MWTGYGCDKSDKSGYHSLRMTPKSEKWDSIYHWTSPVHDLRHCLTGPSKRSNNGRCLYCITFQLYNDTFHIWTRPITPTGSYAIAAVYSKQQGYPIRVSLPLAAVNLTASQGYNVTEVFDNVSVGYLKPAQNLLTLSTHRGFTYCERL